MPIMLEHKTTNIRVSLEQNPKGDTLVMMTEGDKLVKFDTFGPGFEFKAITMYVRYVADSVTHYTCTSSGERYSIEVDYRLH